MDKFEESLKYTQAAAQKLGVSPEVLRNDFIYEFILNHPGFATLEIAVANYFESGRQSATILSNILTEMGYDVQGGLSMLEFASGYGCVTRHLPVVMPKLNSIACDIHAEAINFIADRLHQEVILSNAVPEKLSLRKKFDVVFALSFFSHMPRSTWGRWVAALYKHVRRGGVLLFTTHGNKSMRFFNNPVMSEDGFFFQGSSEQGDLDTAEYGSTIVTRAFVDKQVKESTGTPVALFKEAHWWGHQDLYGIIKK